MERWSVDEVRGVAPDDAALKAATKLAGPGPWSDTGCTDALVWGKCQGSGSKPYQVSVDVLAPAYRCTCPSRKFPCKHALALLLLWAEEKLEAAADPAAFAADWAQERARKAEARAERAERGGAPKDPAAEAKRLESRLQTMDAALADFEVWLGDVVRGGVATMKGRWDDVCEEKGARLVDGMCPALAADVRGLPARIADTGTDAAIASLGRWWTVARAWRRREELDEATLGDLRVALGWAWDGDEIRARPHVADDWYVLGVRRVLQGRLTEQRTWLRGLTTNGTFVLLDFAAGGAPLPLPRLAGGTLTGELAPYPGSWPQRALLVDDPVAGPDSAPPDGIDIAAAVAARAAQRAANPLLGVTPVLLRAAILTQELVQDSSGSLPLVGEVAKTPSWEALALTGGGPTTVFGELDDDGFRPLTLAGTAGVMAL